jgi:hypothetical protein
MEFVGVSVHFGISIPLDDFEGLAQRHEASVGRTSEVESEGRLLSGAGFPEADCLQFVRDVCRWGGYAGVGGRVIKDNSPREIATALREAHGVLQSPNQDLARALGIVNGLKALGTPSFASKHLRFLEPRLCPVFDDYLRTLLPYPFDPRGYAAFAADCSRVAVVLRERGATSPWPGRGRDWFVADVEAAVFQWAREQEVANKR